MTVIAKRVAAELAKRLPAVDHRNIGLRQKLFFFNEHSKGSCFFQPRGARVYNKLLEYLRTQYKQRHYEEVITPNVYDCRLWERSGHWDHYKDNMIRFHMGEYEFSLKPMNCPGHCLMYQQLGRVTADQLPLRLADFGVLHRNESSGALTGLTRMRRFQQDDAHIFCTPDQVGAEVSNCLEFAEQVYGQFDFKFHLALSLRPQKFMGSSELWDKAENSLRDALNATKLPWVEQPEEGAFYGPKIDLTVKDVHERSHQCATIQLDFQLPERFDLVYEDPTAPAAEPALEGEGEGDMSSPPKRPVMIHRAILGSIERFIAMVIENSEGRWPFWLSPVQALVVPVHATFNEYADEVRQRLVAQGFWVDCDTSQGVTFSRKIREAELTRYNFILVVGNRELEADAVSVRSTSSKGSKLTFVEVDKLASVFKHLEDKLVKVAKEAESLKRLCAQDV